MKKREVSERFVELMVANGWDVVDVRIDDTTVPSTHYFTVALKNTQTVEQRAEKVPEKIMEYLFLRGWEIADVIEDSSTVPPTRYYTMVREKIEVCKE
jgi:hypothetical protein